MEGKKMESYKQEGQTKYWQSRSGARAKQVSLFATEPNVFWLIGYEFGRGYFLEAAN